MNDKGGDGLGPGNGSSLGALASTGLTRKVKDAHAGAVIPPGIYSRLAAIQRFIDDCVLTAPQHDMRGKGFTDRSAAAAAIG